MTEKTIKRVASAAAGLLGAVIMMSAAGNISEKNSNVYAFGKDDKITAADVIKIKQSILGYVHFGAGEYERYDINDDGVINFRDLSYARKLFLEDNDISVLIGAVSERPDDPQIIPPATVITDEYVVTTVPAVVTEPVTSAAVTTEAVTTVITTTEMTTTTTVTTTEAVTTTTEVTTAPPVTTTVAATTPVPSRPSSKRLDVGYVLQDPELPTGCEVTALTMLLNHYGFGVNKVQLADIMPKFNFYYINNVLYGADFIDTFPGNPKSSSGYGCYTPCMVKTAEMYFNRIGNEDYYLNDLTGTEFDTLLSYVAAGKPVMAWATMSMIEPYYTTSWVTPDGRHVRWHANEHCLLITGYDKNAGIVYVNDPLKGKTSYSISVFKLRYDQMGKYAAVLMKKGEKVELLKPASPQTPSQPGKYSVGDNVTYSGIVYYSSYGGSTAEVSGTFTITDIVEDESRPYRIRLGTAGWVPYDFQ